ncbi:hypothetical protein QWY85_05425 [Neolewinella lacunae]|uniref:Uncharacterized protein n=1 Tax=Neolewinella lacunae TaxID=1517758 RepID=A0A923T928_9BACT|nr:hypothetical protein [Neolewinella lacunae]MBC6995141.1 hypothetical protein [Neolewinella lacunae]MDN3634091.1 hypothetical protein [Neolewinella lacunae]
MSNRHPYWYPLLILTLLCTCVSAQHNVTPWTEVAIGLPVAGKLKTLTTHEVKGYPWSVGGETMDRDYTIYDNWKAYVEPLGITQVRLQSGWAKTEKKQGQYDFAWLDHHVRDLVKKGVKPWISLSYGNEIYSGGGGIRLGAGLPNSGTAKEGWKRYVRATVARYSDVVDVWEVWNEPNNNWRPDNPGHGNPPEDYAAFLMMTSKIIRELQPKATIIGMASAGIATQWNARVLRYLKANDGLESLDLLCYHPYSLNPDAVDRGVAELRDTLRKYSDRIELYQGENGAPSEFRNTKALSKYNWTELSQAKWFLRRAINDRGQGIGTSIFSIVDLQYPDEINRKGLLLTNDNKEVVRPKHAYSAVQNLVSLFGADVVRRPDFDYKAATYHGVKAYAFDRSNAALVAFWFGDNIPSDYNTTTAVDLTFRKTTFKDPVCVDLRTGQVYEIPASRHRVENQDHVFFGIPVYDSPTVIAERSALPGILK